MHLSCLGKKISFSFFKQCILFILIKGKNIGHYRNFGQMRPLAVEKPVCQIGILKCGKECRIG